MNKAPTSAQLPNKIIKKGKLTGGCANGGRRGGAVAPGGGTLTRLSIFSTLRYANYNHPQSVTLINHYRSTV